jgi:hypothetical protein
MGTQQSQSAAWAVEREALSTGAGCLRKYAAAVGARVMSRRQIGQASISSARDNGFNSSNSTSQSLQTYR